MVDNIKLPEGDESNGRFKTDRQKGQIHGKESMRKPIETKEVQ
jgi:hypothetical protein